MDSTLARTLKLVLLFEYIARNAGVTLLDWTPIFDWFVVEGRIKLQTP